VQLKVMFSCLVGWVERERKPPFWAIWWVSLSLYPTTITFNYTPVAKGQHQILLKEKIKKGSILEF